MWTDWNKEKDCDEDRREKNKNGVLKGKKEESRACDWCKEEENGA